MFNMIKISVTKKDIASGLKREEQRCPVALAIRRKLAKDVSLEVCQSHIKLRLGKVRMKLDAPMKVGFFAASVDYCHTAQHPERFAKNYPVTPFSFYLKIPAAFLKK